MEKTKMSKQLEKLTEKALRIKTNYKRMVNKVLYLVEDFSEIDRKYIKSIKETTQNEAEKLPIITILKGK